MQESIKRFALSIKGFLSEAEGLCLYELALESSKHAPCLEIGSYCGKSAVFLAEACREVGYHPLFSIDHHRGSLEQQPGQPFFDTDLYDEEEKCSITLESFFRNIRKVGLDDWIIPIVSPSNLIGRYWKANSLSLVFIDGSHSEKDVFEDYSLWAPCLIRGGYLCFHDIFPDLEQGGQAPYRVFQATRRSIKWKFVEQVETLGILKRRW
jgi:predicted O-methyltransferase YrrM